MPTKLLTSTTWLSRRARLSSALVWLCETKHMAGLHVDAKSPSPWLDFMLMPSPCMLVEPVLSLGTRLHVCM